MTANKQFQKRRYNFKSLFKDIKQFVVNFKQIKDTFTSQRIERQFAERIMLSVTSVNDCLYCTIGHTGSALKSGAYEAEIISILDNSFDAVRSDELVALNFAKQYARSNNHPTEAQIK
ncbi:MAG: carboxymuconolactone decarboxylase family protein, partial [Candidatus Heimdallarchaeota archaeon]